MEGPMQVEFCASRIWFWLQTVNYMHIYIYIYTHIARAHTHARGHARARTRTHTHTHTYTHQRVHLKFKLRHTAPDRPQHDFSAPCAIAQQYSSATSVSLPLHSPQGTNSVPMCKMLLLFIFIFKHCVGVKLGNVKMLSLLYSFIHSVFCLTTGPKPPLKRFLHIVRSRASSFKWEYPLLSLTSSSSFVRLLPRLLVTSIYPFIFPSITCFRRQFLRKMWPIQLAFRFLISCRIFLCSLTLSNISPFLTWSVQLLRYSSKMSCIFVRF